jgi:hypothetical protein
MKAEQFPWVKAEVEAEFPSLDEIRAKVKNAIAKGKEILNKAKTQYNNVKNQVNNAKNQISKH